MATQSLLGLGALFGSLVLLLPTILQNTSNTEAWNAGAMVLIYLGLALGLVAVGLVSSGVVRWLERPKKKDQSDWLARSVVGLIPALLLGLVVLLGVEGLVRGFAVPLAQIPPP